MAPTPSPSLKNFLLSPSATRFIFLVFFNETVSAPFSLIPYQKAEFSSTSLFSLSHSQSNILALHNTSSFQVYSTITQEKDPENSKQVPLSRVASLSKQTFLFLAFSLLSPKIKSAYHFPFSFPDLSFDKSRTLPTQTHSFCFSSSRITCYSSAPSFPPYSSFLVSLDITISVALVQLKKSF